MGLSNVIKTKQWQLTYNFGSVSTRQNFCTFGEYSQLPKWHFSEICETHQTCQHSPSGFARTCQTCERHVWQVLSGFSKFAQFGKYSECRLDHFIHIKNVICE